MTRGLVAIAAVAGCYSPPQPDCAFVCRPGGACPADYTCAADQQCHRNGTPDSLMCAVLPDAGGPSGPHVLSIVPLNGASGVALDTIPSFLADQDLFDVDTTTFYVMEGNALLSGHVEYPAFSMQPRFIPDGRLAQFTFYRVVIASGITNPAGQPLAPLSWSFITGSDTTPPQVTFTDPASGATNVSTATNVQVVFDEDVTGVDATDFTIDGVVGSVSALGTNIYTFAPAALLPAQTTFTVRLGTGIQDLHGNAFGGYTFSFTTQ